MKFKYTYQKIMQNKKVMRDIAYRNFSESEQLLRTEEEQLSQLKQMVKDSRSLNERLARSKEIDSDSLELLRWTEQFFAGQNIKIQRQMVTIEKSEEQVNQARSLLTEAAQEYRIFEKLKEKMKERFKKVQRKQDLKAVDEIVVMRAARSSGKIEK